MIFHNETKEKLTMPSHGRWWLELYCRKLSAFSNITKIASQVWSSSLEAGGMHEYGEVEADMQRTSDTRLNWSISWCNWEIFSALEIDASCKEVLHSRSSRNSLSTPFALASLSAASAPKILTLSTASDFTSSISLHLIKSNHWYSKNRTQYYTTNAEIFYVRRLKL